MWAMPVTTVVNTIGAISILTSLMNPSPSGLNACAHAGASEPNTMAAATANNTWMC